MTSTEVSEPGSENWAKVDAALRAEAGEFLANGLRDALASYGSVHVVGSYMMELMAWRDLDLHLVPKVLDRTSFFELGSRLAVLLEPQRMHYRDETGAGTVGLPSGLYWGVYLGDERAGGWKLDIWATDARGLERVESYCHAIQRRLSAPTRKVILGIKAQCWQHPEYRRSFGSGDIYEAVLEHGIEDVRGFWSFLEQRPNANAPS